MDLLHLTGLTKRSVQRRVRTGDLPGAMLTTNFAVPAVFTVAFIAESAVQGTSPLIQIITLVAGFFSTGLTIWMSQRASDRAAAARAANLAATTKIESLKLQTAIEERANMLLAEQIRRSEEKREALAKLQGTIETNSALILAGQVSAPPASPPTPPA